MPENDQNQNENPPKLKFMVMPDLEGLGHPPSNARPAPAPSPVSIQTPPPGFRAKPSPPPNPLTGQIKEQREIASANGHGRKRIFIVAAAVVILAIVAGGGFAFWNSKKSQSAADNIDLNNSSSALPIESKQPSTLDSDNDGLTDVQEEDLGTDKNSADTDEDMLADGDEVLIFKTSPFTAHSDSDQYDDAAELLNGYNPIMPGSTKLTDSEVAAIVEQINNGKINKITKDYLLTSQFWSSRTGSSTDLSPPAGSSEQFSYQDPTYGYQLVLPGSWRKSGTNPTNIVFTEKDSPSAVYVQVQAYVGVNDAGEVSSSGLLESEIKRLGKIAIAGVNFVTSKVGGLEASRLSAESKREASAGETNALLTSTVEYIVDTKDAAFIITASCTSTTAQSCMSKLDSLGKSIEQNMRFD